MPLIKRNLLESLLKEDGIDDWVPDGKGGLIAVERSNDDSDADDNSDTDGEEFDTTQRYVHEFTDEEYERMDREYNEGLSRE